MTMIRQYYLRKFGRNLQTLKHYSSNSNGRFVGKNVVITASTQGIGLATARKFAQEGAKVIICSRKQDNVDNALETLNKDGLDVKGLVCHIGKQEDRNKLLHEASTLGGIDVLVQNAGANPIPGPMIKCSESLWDKIFDINLKASFFLAKESLPLIMKRKGGSIIFMASVAAYVPIENIGLYGVSKTALLGLTKSMANEFAQYNVRVNCVAPGFIKTKFGKMLLQDNRLSTVPLNRFGEPDDIASVITFLASNDANYITGETVAITGGHIGRL
ncbi:hypothetical protein RI129_000568 [Pyrocoelia pectoralis]|uniref:Dehydrogenase/reductase SDR family member 4 n=1 Tax=Pyrocoelia pectoralis TaxID=417401 RepID=A0AAN7VRV2_9COLE